MPIKFDLETLQRFRSLTPDQICAEVTAAVHRAPEGGGSEDFLDALGALVDEGLLSWEDIENSAEEEN
jgi:hypothetical protein